MILDQIVEEYNHFYQIDPIRYGQLHKQAFVLSYTAFMTKYKTIQGVAKQVDGNTFSEAIMNESINRFGNGGEEYNIDTYTQAVGHIYAPTEMSKIHMGRAYMEGLASYEGRGKDNANTQALMHIAEQSYDQAIQDPQQNTNIAIDNILDTFEEETMKRWLPIQEEIAMGISRRRMTTRHENLISQKQIQKVEELLEPGDILVQRRNWYLTNTSMPGFWTHAALYLGSLDELEVYFEKEAQEVLGMGLSQYLAKNYPKFLEEKNAIGRDIAATIEGKGEGIIQMTLNQSADADYLGAIRPKLSKKDKLQAILTAISYYGTPYDFNFDFTTDDEMVCSELVYKSYLKKEGKEGLVYTLSKQAGRDILTPQDMVRTFDENYGTDQEQNEFVLFLDGSEKRHGADFVGVETFRRSWQRPKYDVILNL